jgi:hypothetical protein
VVPLGEVANICTNIMGWYVHTSFASANTLA